MNTLDRLKKDIKDKLEVLESDRKELLADTKTFETVYFDNLHDNAARQETLVWVLELIDVLESEENINKWNDLGGGY